MLLIIFYNIHDFLLCVRD